MLRIVGQSLVTCGWNESGAACLTEVRMKCLVCRGLVNYNGAVLQRNLKSTFNLNRKKAMCVGW
jgi:hypothetical protein